MSTAKRRWILCGLGVLGGLLSWPITELVLRYQAAFPSYLVFSIALGALCGLVLGAFFGGAYGITSYIKRRIGTGMASGALIGIAGGIIGFLIGQAALFVLGNLILTSQKNVELIGLPVARALGWSFVGVFLGMSEGLRILSLKKIAVGALGGFIGGLFGGFLLEYAHVLLPAFAYGRLLGLVLLGLLIGFFYGLVEKQLSFGVLRILNGAFRGKEYLLGQARMTVGSGARCDINLSGYRNVVEVHADIVAKRGEVTIRQRETGRPLVVNEEKVEQQVLKFEDAIRIGSAKLYYLAE
jgi:hypothetical protein